MNEAHVSAYTQIINKLGGHVGPLHIGDIKIVAMIVQAANENVLSFESIARSFGIITDKISADDVRTIALSAMVEMKNGCIDLFAAINGRMAKLHQKFPYCVGQVVVTDQIEQIQEEEKKKEKAERIIPERKVAYINSVEDAETVDDSVTVLDFGDHGIVEQNLSGHGRMRDMKKTAQRLAFEYYGEKPVIEQKIAYINSVEDAVAVDNTVTVLDFGDNGIIEQNQGRGKRRNMQSTAIHYAVLIYQEPESIKLAIEMIGKVITDNNLDMNVNQNLIRDHFADNS